MNRGLGRLKLVGKGLPRGSVIEKTQPAPKNRSEKNPCLSKHYNPVEIHWASIVSVPEAPIRAVSSYATVRAPPPPSFQIGLAPCLFRIEGFRVSC